MAQELLKIKTSTFDNEVKKSETPVLVAFCAPWCSNCGVMENIMLHLAGEYEGKVKFAKVDIDEEPLLRDDHEVLSIPTLFLYKNGYIAKKNIGAISKQQLNSFLSAGL